MRQAASHRLFQLAVSLKALDGILELVGGMLLLFLSPSVIHSLVYRVTAHELSEDPHDRLAELARHAVDSFGGSTQSFATLYLLAHGVVKLVLVWALLREYRPAFPAAIAFFSAFVAYQLYRFTHTHSLVLLATSVVDLVVIALVWREYDARYRRGSRSRA